MTKLGLGVMAMAIAAAPQTLQPGQMTQARVYVENRGLAEAIPVDLRESNLDTPLRVRVVNATTWEYETVTIASDQDAAIVLNRQGAAGWETTGVTFTSPKGTTVVLKRSH